MKSLRRTIGLFGVAALVLTLARAQNLASFEKRITLKVLDNGLTVLVCERPEAPVFSYFTHVDVGSDRE
jgi:predicted Zn-dependent peptidase